MATDNMAHTTKRVWKASWHELEYKNNSLEEERVTPLKRFLEFGEGTCKGQVKRRENTRSPEPMVLHRASSKLGHPILKSIL